MLESALEFEHRLELDRIAQTILSRGPSLAFTGAGISTESGIPDFRGPSGLWKRTAPTGFRDFLNDPAVRARYWERRRERYPELASKLPNVGHQSLQQLMTSGVLDLIVTQNIDGLHQKAGVESDRVIELHGSSHQIRCLSCRSVFAADSDEIDFDAPIPGCPRCDGILKEATISFGEPLIEEDLRRALRLAEEAGMVLVVGSSLTVNPASRVPLVAARHGASVAIINNEETPLDRYAEYLVRAPAGASLSYLTRQVLAGV
ncbi:MAG: Sir2 family NAD-dependent protein deacetylase [Thermomicrobiaceae bacterium]